MSYKIWSLVSLGIITLVGVVLFIQTTQFRSQEDAGPAFFPQLIISLMIIFCIISAITTLFNKKTENKEIKIPNFSRIFFTIVCLVIFTLIWDLLGFSYILSFLFLFGLLFVYNQKDLIKQKIIMATVVSGILNLFIFLVFDQLLNIAF